MTDNRPLSEVFAEIGAEWVDANAAANLLEDCKSAFLAEKMLLHADLAVSRQESLVKASEEWKEYIRKCVAARKRADLAKVRMETVRMRFSEWQSEEANERVKAKF